MWHGMNKKPYPASEKRSTVFAVLCIIPAGTSLPYKRRRRTGELQARSWKRNRPLTGLPSITLPNSRTQSTMFRPRGETVPLLPEQFKVFSLLARDVHGCPAELKTRIGRVPVK